MKNYNFILTIIFSMLFFSLVEAQKTPFHTKWQTTEFSQVENLSNMDFLYDSEDKLLYLITNDNENLYIHVRALEDEIQKKIIEFGFSVEIKIKGDKEKRNINFPLAKKERMEPVILLSDNSEKKRRDFRLIKEQVVKQIYVMKLTGFNGKEIEQAKCTENKYNIQGKLSINNNGNLQYLMTIPLKALSLKVGDDKLFAVTLSSGSMSTGDNNGPMDNDGGGQRGQGGPQQGNDRSAGGMGGNSGGIGDYGGMGSAGGVGNGGDRSQGQSQRQGPPPGYGGQNSEMAKPIKVKLKNVVLVEKAN